MCGIVGYAARESRLEPATLDAMRDRMRHRGPDDEGSWWSEDRTVGLAMRRLSIIDLAPTGRQPMADASGRFHLVFNGEIYNHAALREELEAEGHRFRGTSDTEVLLEAYRAWGTGCLDRLEGMFAFALHDPLAGEVFAARDRAGEKPLFYRHADGQLWFASELKSLLAAPSFPRALDGRALEHYLAHGYVPGSLCLLNGVHKLPPAHAMRYRVGADALDLWRYWELPAHAPRPDVPTDSLVEQLDALLLESVRRRLVADVPVGILLSGGIDSSLVTAMAARATSAPVRTFTITFPGHGAYDEREHASRVARHFGTAHTELAVEPASADLLPRLAEQFDEPIADSSMVPTYLVSRLVREHATVALGGDGGDELFGGYTHYSRLLREQALLRPVPKALRTLVVKAAQALPEGARGRNYTMGLGADLVGSLLHVNTYFDETARRGLLQSAPAASGDARSPDSWWRGLRRDSDTLLQQATRSDFAAYLPDDILVKVDRASMLASLEVRAPWLDRRIVEFAYGAVPDALRATATERKILPRRLAERLLPRGASLARKQGFSMPLQAWFRGDWGATIARILLEADGQIFRPDAVRRLLDGQRRGRSNAARLFALAVFELWRRTYAIAAP